MVRLSALAVLLLLPPPAGHAEVVPATGAPPAIRVAGPSRAASRVLTLAPPQDAIAGVVVVRGGAGPEPDWAQDDLGFERALAGFLGLVCRPGAGGAPVPAGLLPPSY